MLTAPHLTEETFERSCLSILRASRMSGHRITKDTLHRDRFKKQCLAFERAGLATFAGSAVFITNKGMEKSVGGGA